MTSSKSLFNAGIFKNTLKRFRWGSFLYFLILFFSLPFILMVQRQSYIGTIYGLSGKEPLIFSNGFIAMPMLLAFIVPTIVTALVFHGVHSAKQGNFIHSLPLTRLENYISSILASLTLMAVPLLLNAVILLVLSFTKYSGIITVSSIVYWFFLNLTVCFIMLSVSVFSAILTGHTVAHIGINVLLHIAPTIVALGIYLVSETFLFGFSEGFLTDRIVYNTPLVWLFHHSAPENGVLDIFTHVQMWIFIAMALVFYAISYLLYRHRKIEACGDVAAFKVFRPILKYTATAFAAILTFGVLQGTTLGAVPVFITAAVVTCVIYFSCEMLIRKSFKVFGSYKGYIGFAVFVAVLISLFAYTDIFGFEKRIPNSSDIESASIYSTAYGKNIPMVADYKLIDDVRTLHAEFISNIPITEKNEYNNFVLVKYALKNGKTLTRKYNVADEVLDRALSNMYNFPEYKHILYGLDTINTDKVENLEIRMYSSNFNYNVTDKEHAKELLEAAKKDLATLSYEEIEGQNFATQFSLCVSETRKSNEKLGVFDAVSEDSRFYTGNTYYLDIAVNSNFKNTLEILKKTGFYDNAVNSFKKSLRFCPIPLYVKGDDFTFKQDTGKEYEFLVSTDDMIVPSAEESKALAEKLINEPITAFENRYNISDGKYYMIFAPADNYQTVDLGSYSAIFKADELPGYLGKYISE